MSIPHTIASISISTTGIAISYVKAFIVLGAAIVR
jgi:hypothetical protein